MPLYISQYGTAVLFCDVIVTPRAGDAPFGITCSFGKVRASLIAGASAETADCKASGDAAGTWPDGTGPGRGLALCVRSAGAGNGLGGEGVGASTSEIVGCSERKARRDANCERKELFSCWRRNSSAAWLVYSSNFFSGIRTYDVGWPF